MRRYLFYKFEFLLTASEIFLIPSISVFFDNMVLASPSIEITLNILVWKIRFIWISDEPFKLGYRRHKYKVIKEITNRSSQRRKSND